MCPTWRLFVHVEYAPSMSELAMTHLLRMHSAQIQCASVSIYHEEERRLADPATGVHVLCRLSRYGHNATPRDSLQGEVIHGREHMSDNRASRLICNRMQHK